MTFNSQLPIWLEEGTEPAQSFIENGMKANDGLPADWLNYQWNRTYKALEEIQQKAGQVKTVGGIEPDINGDIDYVPDRSIAADKLTTARTINGTPFDGSQNISFGRLEPISIPTGTDLNSLQNPGMYFVTSNTTVATFSNSPTTYAFSLLVEKHAGVKQTLTEFSVDGTQRRFWRNHYSNQQRWSEWTQDADYRDVSSVMLGKEIKFTNFFDYNTKIAGSTYNNANLFKGTRAPNLQTPIQFTYEAPQEEYDKITKLDGIVSSIARTTTDGEIPQQLFSFDLVNALEKKYGIELWGGSTSLADKVSKLKGMIAGLTINWYGYGVGTSGNLASLKAWISQGTQWTTTPIQTTSNTVSKVILGITDKSLLQARIDSNGFVHYIVYAPASNGITQTMVYTDYVSLEVSIGVTSGMNRQTVASDVDIADSGNYYTSSNAEGALQEIGQTMNSIRGSLVQSAQSLLGM